MHITHTGYRPEVIGQTRPLQTNFVRLSDSSTPSNLRDYHHRWSLSIHQADNFSLNYSLPWTYIGSITCHFFQNKAFLG